MLTSHRVFLGIDPGLSGAFAVYDAQANSVINARIIPTLVLQRNRKQKRTLDIPTLVLVSRELAHQHPDMVAYLELVNAAPIHGRRQGGSSMFNFGATNGAIKASIVAAGIPYDLVPPAVWKKALACSQDKDEALARASELMPSSTDFWTPKRNKITKEGCIGVAEAAMIAWWGSRYGKLSTPLPLAACHCVCSHLHRVCQPHTGAHTMLENLDKPIAQLDTLTTAEIRTIQDQLAAAEERQKKRKDAFAALMERRFGDAARQAYKDEKKDTGTVRVTPGGSNLLELKAEIDKTVVWDQDGLLKLLNGMKPADAKHYGKIKVEVPEAKFTGAPPDVQAQLKPLRTVKPGKLKLSLVDRKLEAEAA